ncbi:MAG TPA: hypothetical protein V6D30_21320 [Leptolyngbyaceae cyanobacterium]
MRWLSVIENLPINPEGNAEEPAGFKTMATPHLNKQVQPAPYFYS